MKPFRRVAAFMLAAILIVSLCPIAMAASGAPVLLTIGHKYTNTVPVSSNPVEFDDIELEVPFSYPGNTVDLSNGLTITYDTDTYTQVVAKPNALVPISEDPDNLLPAVSVDVSYYYLNEADGTERMTTTYRVVITRKDKVDPTFSGSLFKETTAPGEATFITTDFLSKYMPNDGAGIGSISLTGSNPSFGALKYNNNPYDLDGTNDLGEKIPVDAEHINQLRFAATAPGTVSYNVTAYATDLPNIAIGNVVLTITAYTVPTINTPITHSVTKGTKLDFNAAFFTSHCDTSGVPIETIEIMPTNSGVGTWALNKVSFSGVKSIPISDLSLLSFTATATGDALFNWRVSNKAGFSTTGAGTITVTSPTLSCTSFVAATEILKGGTHMVTQNDFRFTPETASLEYIKLTSIPAAADGYICLTTALPKSDVYSYPALKANTALTVNSVIPYEFLKYLKIFTKTTSKNNNLTFTWTVTSDMKVTTATWGEQALYTVNFITGDTLPYRTDMNVPLALSAPDISNRFLTRTGGQLSYVMFTLPDRTAGTLYYDYDLVSAKGTAVTAATKYYTDKNPNLAGVTFVPAKDFTGSVTVTYNAYDENGNTITGALEISVKNAEGGTLSLQVDKNSPLQFDAGDFRAAFLAASGKELSYIVFTGQPTISASGMTSGTLYYDCDLAGRGGSLVSTGSVYYLYASQYLSLVSYVPAHNFVGQIEISFKGYTGNGSEYEDGKIVISVVDSAAGIVTYTMAEDGFTTLSGQDFSDEFVGVTGSILNYVTFTPPPSTLGVLYDTYDATKKTGKAVSAATKYYDGRTPDISGLTFVPAKNFVGTVVVTYKAYNSAGQLFLGKLKFLVSQSAQLITYETVSNSYVSMGAGDFQGAFSLLSGGKALSYVTFDLPSPSCGRLYYNYSSSTSYDSAVVADRKYYMSYAPYLSRVSFVPTNSYSGSFTLNYTGYTAEGEAHTGKVRVTVKSSASESVNYTTNSITPARFNAADFTAAYKESGTLSYIRFTSLPYSSYGKLYYGYISPASPGTPVTASSVFYMTGAPSVSNISFVPNENYSGTLAVAYTAYNTSGIASSGTLLILVKSGDLDTVLYSTQANKPAFFNAEDFNVAFLNKTGQSLSHVIFTLPSSDVGRLYLGYSAPGSYTSAVVTGGKYYRYYSPRLSDVSFVPKEGFTGTTTISYTGYTTNGVGYYGTILVNVGITAPFPDMKTGFDWAAPAVSYLYTNGIVKGNNDGNFHPVDNVKRGDFILMVTRAFGLTSYSSDNFPDVPTGSYYYDAIATAKYFDIVTGTGGNFYPAAPLSRQDAMVILKRTLDIKGIALAEGAAYDLSAFSDAYLIADYAVPAMASLVKAGVLTGSGGKLHPEDMITRAEMAVILYKVLML